uniref:Uncharacterized protein n=1 Tax=Peronospora matthiolae TaxID=2874970 RepID=A0AAV1UGA5_9STRA
MTEPRRRPKGNDVSVVLTRRSNVNCADDNDVSVRTDDDSDVEQEVANSENSSEAEETNGQKQAETNCARGRGRRPTFFWSVDEEHLLCRGVAKYGAGKWKKILLSGKGVFSIHRTNVDLKDKWKNMQRMNHINRKRTAEVQNLARHKRSSIAHATRVAADQSRSGDGVGEMSSVNSVELRTDPSTAMAAGAMASTDQHATRVRCTQVEADMYHAAEHGRGYNPDATGSFQSPRQVVLQFVCNNSFPEITNVRVDLDTCKDVSTLTKLLRSNILSGAPPNEDVQMIGLTSRQLFQHDELLLQCMRINNGTDFFLVFDEAAAVFV